MKLSKVLLTLLGCALMVTACGESNSSGGFGAADGITSIDDIILDESEDSDEPEIITKTCEEVSGGQCGGSLTDLLVGSYIEPNYSYTCSFTHSKTFSGEYTIKSDDRTIAQVTHKAGTGSFTVKGITPGDAIIQAVTEENEIVLQFVVHVRNRIPMNKIAETLYNVDIFTGMAYGYKLSFIKKSPLTGVLSGNDDFESSYVNFKLIDGVEEKVSESFDFNTYKFKISVDMESSATTRTYTDLYVSTTGEKIFMYYSNGLVDIFTSYGLSMYSGSWN